MDYGEYLKALGKRIHELRRNLPYRDPKTGTDKVGPSQHLFSQMAFIRQSQIQSIEAGTANPTMQTMGRIARALNVGIDKLLSVNDK